MWFLKRQDSQIVKLYPNGGMEEYDIPNLTPGGAISNITIGSQGEAIFLYSNSSESNPTRTAQIVIATQNGVINSIPFTLPTTPNNSADTSFFFNTIEQSIDGNFFVVAHGAPESSITAVKVNNSGSILNTWDIEGNGTTAGSAVDPSGNLWIAPAGDLIKITPAGQIYTFPLQNIGFALDIETDNSGNIWILPNAKHSFSQPDVIAQFNQNEQITYHNLLPTGAIANGYPGILKAPNGEIYFTTMQLPENNTLGKAYLYKINQNGTMQQVLEFNTEDFPIDLAYDDSGNLWGLFISPTEDPSEANFRVAKFIDYQTEPIITPTVPKSGNNAAFIVISSLAIASCLLFIIYAHKKHQKYLPRTKKETN